MRKTIVCLILVLMALALVFLFRGELPEPDDKAQLITVGPGESLVEKRMNVMRAELVSLSKAHPILRGIEKDELSEYAAEPPNVFSFFYCKKATLPEDAGWMLIFSKNTVTKACPSMFVPVPTHTGAYLKTGISSRFLDIQGAWPLDEYWILEKGSHELFMGYSLVFGEDLKRSDAPTRKILHQNLQALNDEIRKMYGWVTTKTVRRK